MKELKNVYILGDSYSTFNGYTYRKDVSYYPNGYVLDIKNVEQTWWYALSRETGCKIIDNDSWSGSSVCNTGYDGEDCTHWSFVTRVEQYCKDNDTSLIDTVFVFGGTNDCWSGAPLGEIKYQDISVLDKKKFFPAYSYLIQYIKSKFVNAKIYAIINDSDTLTKEIIDGIKTICKELKAEYIELKSIEKSCGHPDANGMLQIKNQILEHLK